MADAGAEVIDDLELTPKAEIVDSETIVMATEFKAGLNRYLSERAPKARIRSLNDAIAFNRHNHDTVMPYFRQERFERSAEMGALTDQAYLTALATSRRLAREDGIDRLLGEHDLDAIVAPTTCPPWLIDWVNGDNRSGGSACPAAVAGYPSITVPGGYVFGLPVGLSFFATAFKEAELIRLAIAFENATQARRPPPFADRAEN
jgi:amidase